MNMYKSNRQFIIKRILTAVFTILGMSAQTQDIHFSQFYESPLSRNPALAGIFTGNMRIQAIHRDQWTSIEVPFKTSLISFEYKMPVGDYDDYITSGTSGYKDLAGNNMLTTTNVQQSLTYHKSLDNISNRYLSVGFSGGYTSKKVDPAILTFDNQYGSNGFDAALPSGEVFRDINRNNFELTTGISYNSAVGERGNFFLGGSVWYLLRDRSNFLRDSSIQMKKWQFNGGIKTYIATRIILHLESNIFIQNASKELMAGGMISYVSSGSGQDQGLGPQLSLGAGAFVRMKDAIIPVIKVGYRNFSIAFSTDLNTSKLKSLSQGRGGFEVSLSYITGRQSESFEEYRCPKF